MYKIKIISHFCGAHFLRNYKGKCESLHGHNWKVEIIVSSNNLDKSGMVMDFSELKGFTNRIMDELDHKNLNDLDYFKKSNPSSEEICFYIFTRVKEPVENRGCVLEEVCVWETDTACAVYREDKLKE